MPRQNPRVAHLERENDRLRQDLAARRADPGDLPVIGCRDNSCVVARPVGPGTNGGCRCGARDLRWALVYYRRLAAFREESVRELRDEVARLQQELGDVQVKEG